MKQDVRYVTVSAVSSIGLRCVRNTLTLQPVSCRYFNDTTQIGKRQLIYSAEA